MGLKGIRAYNFLSDPYSRQFRGISCRSITLVKCANFACLPQIVPASDYTEYSRISHWVSLSNHLEHPAHAIARNGFWRASQSGTKHRAVWSRTCTPPPASDECGSTNLDMSKRNAVPLDCAPSGCPVLRFKFGDGALTLLQNGPWQLQEKGQNQKCGITCPIIGYN